MNKPQKKNKLILLLLATAFIVLGFLLVLLSYLRGQGILFVDNHFGVIDQSLLTSAPLSSLPQSTLYITNDRKAYIDSTMRLIVPSLGIDTPIGANTLPRDLEKLPGLYEFSQMPSRGDVNVSIAGHRDVFGKEFYSLDKLKDDDSFYLVYGDMVYEYVFYDSMVVADDDWSVIHRQGFSALTLTTCDPIGTRLHRLVSVAILVDTYPMSDTLSFS